MKTSESTIHIRQARIAAKRVMRKPRKNSINPHYQSRYSSFEEIMRVIEDAFLPNDLDVDFEIVRDGDEIGARVIISHAPSGEFLEYEPVFMPVGKKTPQGYGSIISYVKRYAICAACSIAADIDDDANTVEDEVKKTTMRIKKSLKSDNRTEVCLQTDLPYKQNDHPNPHAKERLDNARRWMFAFCNTHGIDNDTRRGIIKRTTGKESSTLLTLTDYAVLAREMKREYASSA